MAAKSDTGLTAQQRRWLKHLREWKRSGGTLKSYAAREGLSAQSLYQAACALRKRGMWTELAGASRCAYVPAEAGRGFERVELASEARAVCSWRARLPNGVLVEAAGDLTQDLLASLAKL